MRLFPTAGSALALVLTLAIPALAAEPLTPAGRIELPGYTGDFDHVVADVAANRLYLAAEDHGTLDVFDIKAMKKLQSVKAGIGTPHSLLLVPGTDRLVVTDSDKGTKVFSTKTLKPVGKIVTKPGADSAGFDAPRGRYFIVAGGKDGKLPDSYLTEVDPVTGKVLGELKFATPKVEAMAVEQNGPNLYINVTGTNQLAVVDKASRSVVKSWPVKEAEQNAPIAMDEPNHRLFVATRKPGMMVVVNAETGASVASFKGPERCDEIVWDQANKRIYMLGGEGYIGVWHQDDADHYTELAHVQTAPGAKTGTLVPELGKLFVVVSPGEGKKDGAILAFTVNP